MGCESSEADPMEQGKICLLRSSAPTFYRVRSLRDPDADDPHDSPVDKVFGEMLLFEQGDVWRGSYERDADDSHGSLGG